MDHPWRPHQIQGNICPTCSMSHFPFCPPPPQPSNFNPNYYPTNTRPSFHNPGDPYCDPGYIHRNPSFPHVGDFGNANRPPYPMQNLGYADAGYVGNDYSNTIDRSSKRLRVDNAHAYDGSYGVGPESGAGAGGAAGGIDGNFVSTFQMEGSEGRLKLVDDHGGPNMRYGVGGDVDGWHPRNSGEIGSRPPTNIRSSGSLGMGYNLHHQRDGLDYQTGYGSQYDMKRGASDVGYQNHDQRDRYGHIGNLPGSTGFYQGGAGHGNYQQPNGSSESGYGSYESRHPSNGPVHYDQRSNMPTPNHYARNRPPIPSAMQQPGQMSYDYGSPHRFCDVRQPSAVQGFHVPIGNRNPPIRPHYHGGYESSISENMGHSHQQAFEGFDAQPPLPASPPPPPPPPLPMEPPVQWSAEHKTLKSPPRMSSSLFPVSIDSLTLVHSSHTPLLPITRHGHTARNDLQRDAQSNLRSYGQYLGDGQTYSSKNSLYEKPKVVDAAHLFKPPHRASRPDHFVIILRGLPGSGKSYLAKMLRDLEVEYGGKAPRIHSMDDYFMTEVDQVDENEASKPTGRVKKPTMKTVLEYCYEPEMEEAYRSSMLKAFKKTLEDGAFTFVIVDDRNLRVADFSQFWATAKRSGYEVYVLEAPYKDPAGCTARNVHGFTQVDVEKMAAQWEEAPSMYLQVDVKSLFHGDDLKESNIEEVDMDMEDGGVDGVLLKVEDREAEKIITSSAHDPGLYDFGAEVGNPSEVVKDLGRSKWSDLDGDDDEKTELLKRKVKVLSGSVVTCGRESKSVHWGDQNGHTGFFIGAVKKANMASLVIGPGAGYNLKSNPLPEEEAASGKHGEMKQQRSKFQERLRAEQESFKAVFDKRRHRISGLDAQDD